MTLNVWAYIFVTTRRPKVVLKQIRSIKGVAHADALFGSPDIIAIVSGSDIADMDAVIDRIAEIPDILATDSKVARWLDGIQFPGLSHQ
jgi:DNA-binding Lrp family transcriptional regulator